MATKIRSVFSLIQANILDRPDAPAVTQGDGGLSYGDLGSNYRAISNLLGAQGVGVGDIVPILTTRCPLAVTCVLAVMAAGATFVPMDAGSWSRQRVETVLNTVEHKCLLVTKGTAGIEWLSASNETIVWVGNDELTGAGPCIGHPSGDAGNKKDIVSSVGVVADQGPRSLDDCAYIIFTSGTTGRPKGVAVAHRSVLNYVESGDAHAPFNMGVGRDDGVLLLFSVAFDAYYGVLLSTLCHGGRVVVSEPSTLASDVGRCTILPVTPTLLGTLPAASDYPGVRAVFLGGESPPPELVRKWWSPRRRLYNAYGPTEATIAATIAELRPDAPVTLGVPIRHSRMLLLDDELRPCAEGEICIAGENLAIGYYKDEARTAEKFVYRQTEDGGRERVYRTGDLGKRGAEDDAIVFLGRRDHVVKNRGFLINIEAEVLPALLAQPGVASAAAFMHRQRLVAFIAPASACAPPEALHSAMAGRYDDFIVPDDLRALEVLPQTANGKIDTTALAALLGAPGVGPASSPGAPRGGSRSEALRDAVAEALGTPLPSVDMASSFKALGGNSLLAIKLLFRLQQSGFTLPLSQLFALPSLAQASDCLLATTAAAATPRDPDKAPSSMMTATQMGIVASTLRDPPRGYMVVEMSLPHGDPGMLNRLEGAWTSVIRRHAIFRASFDLVGGTFSTNQEPVAVDWQRPVVAPDDADAVQRESDRLIARAREHALASDGTAFRPLVAFTLVVAGANTKPALLWLVHHAQVDGWSIGAVVRDVRALLYGDGGGPLSSSPVGSNFTAYADALGQYVDGVRDEAARFWSEALDGMLDGTGLKLAPPSSAPPALDDEDSNTHAQDPTGGFGSRSLDLGVTLAEAELNARVYGVSPAVAFYAAWALLLGRYSGRNDVVFGTVLSGRTFPLADGDVGSIVGPLINTCPFPVRTRDGDDGACPNSSKASFLASVRDRILAVADYQWSVAEALDRLAPGSHAAIYGTAVFLEYDLDGFTDNQDQGGPWLFERRDMPDFGLTLQGQCGAGGELVFRALFDRALYPDALVGRMLSHFRNLYLALMDPRVSDVGQVRTAMMDGAEFLAVTRQSPNLFEPYSGPATLKDAFEAGLDLWPDAVAIDSPVDGMLTYRELDAMADRLAGHLSSLVPPSGRRVVAIIGDRSRNWLVGALSIVKAGAVYLPLDSKLPEQRMRVMVETAGAAACLYPDEKSLGAFPGVHPLQIVVDGVQASAGSTATTRLPTTATTDEHAYIMFTSGSTGVPKGICIPHRAVVSHLAYGPARMEAGPGRRHAQMFSPGFDVSIAEVFGTLCNGATLVLPDSGEGTDPFAHLGRVHATMMTPSFLAVCRPADLANLDTIYLIGEAVSQRLADAWCADSRRAVYNFYGPAECTIAALFKRLAPGAPVTLGRPIPRVGVYILDAARRPVPVGVVGEIYLSGVQVAAGYIGDHMADATRAVFLDDPFVPGLRMYKTGDAAAWTEALEVQFLGRLDDSLVKVRGYRVELDEVAHAVQRADARVQAAVAVVSEDGDRILAFVRPATVDTESILTSLADELPPYARPSVLLALDSFPTTPNQKLDRKALRQLASQSVAKSSPGQPPAVSSSQFPAKPSSQSSGTETLLARVWSEVLRLPEELEPSGDDDFLALGGNSLRQITAAQKVSFTLGVRVPVGLFVKNTCLRQLAKELDLFYARHDVQRVGEGAGPSFLKYLAAAGHQEKNDDDVGTASHLELELFEMHERSRNPSTFNVAHVVELGGRVDLDILEQAARQVVRENDMLRCCFQRDAKDGHVRRVCYSTPDKAFVVHRWGSEVDHAAKEKDLIQKPFDLAEDQLTRLALVTSNTCADSEPTSKIVLVQHHIITDQTSVRRFFQRLGELYSRHLDGETDGSDKNEEAPPGSTSPSYAAWARWRSGQVQRTAVGSTVQGRFWKERFAGAAPRRLFPPRPPADEGFGHASFTAYPPPPAGATPWPMEHYLAAVALALGQAARTDDVVVCIPFIDRLEPGTDQILGLFLDRLPVRMRLPPALVAAATEEEEKPDPRGRLLGQTVAAARREVQAALDQALPGRCIAEVVAGEGGDGQATAEGLFDVMLVYNRWDDRVAGDLRMRGITSVRSAAKRAPGAKFPFLIEFNELEDGAVVCEMEYMPERADVGFVEQVRAELEKILWLLEGV